MMQVLLTLTRDSSSGAIVSQAFSAAIASLSRKIENSPKESCAVYNGSQGSKVLAEEESCIGHKTLNTMSSVTSLGMRLG